MRASEGDSNAGLYAAFFVMAVGYGRGKSPMAKGKPTKKPHP